MKSNPRQMPLSKQVNNHNNTNFSSSGSSSSLNSVGMSMNLNANRNGIVFNKSLESLDDLVNSQVLVATSEAGVSCKLF